MKWLGLPLLLLLVFSSPVTLAAGCGSQSAAIVTTCGCCSGPESCCLDSNPSDANPIKNAFAPAPAFPVLAPPHFTYSAWFTPPVLQRIQRIYPPSIQVRPPPDSTTLCTFLI